MRERKPRTLSGKLEGYSSTDVDLNDIDCQLGMTRATRSSIASDISCRGISDDAEKLNDECIGNAHALKLATDTVGLVRVTQWMDGPIGLSCCAHVDFLHRELYKVPCILKLANTIYVLELLLQKHTVLD